MQIVSHNLDPVSVEKLNELKLLFGGNASLTVRELIASAYDENISAINQMKTARAQFKLHNYGTLPGYNV